MHNLLSIIYWGIHIGITFHNTNSQVHPKIIDSYCTHGYKGLNLCLDLPPGPINIILPPGPVDNDIVNGFWCSEEHSYQWMSHQTFPLGQILFLFWYSSKLTKSWQEIQIQIVLLSRSTYLFLDQTVCLLKDHPLWFDLVLFSPNHCTPGFACGRTEGSLHCPEPNKGC